MTRFASVREPARTAEEVSGSPVRPTLVGSADVRLAVPASLTAGSIGFVSTGAGETVVDPVAAAAPAISAEIVGAGFVVVVGVVVESAGALASRFVREAGVPAASRGARGEPAGEPAAAGAVVSDEASGKSVGTTVAEAMETGAELAPASTATGVEVEPAVTSVSSDSADSVADEDFGEVPVFWALGANPEPRETAAWSEPTAGVGVCFGAVDWFAVAGVLAGFETAPVEVKSAVAGSVASAAVGWPAAVSSVGERLANEVGFAEVLPAAGCPEAAEASVSGWLVSSETMAGVPDVAVSTTTAGWAEIGVDTVPPAVASRSATGVAVPASGPADNVSAGEAAC